MTDAPMTNGEGTDRAVKRVASAEELVDEIVEGIYAIARGCAALELTNFTESADKSAHNAAMVEKWKVALTKKILALTTYETRSTTNESKPQSETGAQT